MTLGFSRASKSLTKILLIDRVDWFISYQTLQKLPQTCSVILAHRSKFQAHPSSWLRVPYHGDGAYVAVRHRKN